MHSQNNPIPSNEFLLRVARLDIGNGLRSVDVTGRNPDISPIDDPQDVWNEGGLYTGQPTGALESVELFSADTNDTAGGTGMRSIRVRGLRTTTSTEYEQVDYALNGTTPVDLGEWYRISTAFGLTYGSNASNVGKITIRQSVTTANVFATIDAGSGRSQVAAFTVPHQREAYIMAYRLAISRTSGAAGSAHIDVLARQFGSGGYNIARSLDVTTSNNATHDYSHIPIYVPARTDLIVRVEEVSDNNTIVNGEIDILICPVSRRTTGVDY